MVKIFPLLRIVRIVQFIKERNDSKIKVSRKSIFDYVALIYPDYDYTSQTFDRDKRKMKEELGIPLEYNASEGYYIDSSESLEFLETSLDYYDLYTILNDANVLPEIFLLTDRRPKGMHLIKDVVHHIKNRQVIQFNYLKYDSNLTEIRQVEPLAIKESRERWYLIGNDHFTNKGLRAFAFDRMANINFQGNKFSPKYTLENIISKYNDLFAMFDAEEKNVETIILHFDKRDGNYIKSFPLHHSQQVLDIEDGVEVKLKIKPTLDFIMEIMSRAWSLKVISPNHLKLEVQSILLSALDRNS